MLTFLISMLILALTLAAVRVASSVANATASSSTDARSCLVKAFQSGQQHDRKEFSQFGEDGIIEVMHRCIGREFKGTYVEFGTESCHECTTKFLRQSKGWTGLLLDGGHSNPSINLQKELIYYDNIVSLFQKYKVPMEFDHLTVDLDLNTFYPAQAVLAAGYRPRALVMEMNRNFDDTLSQAYVTLNLPNSRCTFSTGWGIWGERVPNAGGMKMNCYYGASPLALTRLAQHFGYLPIALDQAGVNIFFIHSNEVGGLKPPTSQAGGNAPGDPIDEDFNLAKAVKSLGAHSTLGRSMHAACHLNAWNKVPRGLNFSSPDWMEGLELVVLGQGENGRGRTFTEEKLVSGGKKKTPRVD